MHELFILDWCNKLVIPAPLLQELLQTLCCRLRAILARYGAIVGDSHMIIGERERANLVVHLAAIFLYIWYMGIYITGAAHTVIPI